jgi:5'-deoxynucleotidase YfbR-like HD superfamily hydrolase
MSSNLEHAPDRLQENIHKLFKIKRFSSYEEGIFSNNVGQHTLQCVELASDLPVDPQTQDKIKGILWIHDIPEIITSDRTVIEIEELGLEKDTKLRETKAAKKLLSKSDQKLLVEFNRAHQVLKGNSDEDVRPEAGIAAIIDRIEGNVEFHRSLSKWCGSDNYERHKLPSSNALRFTLETHNTFTQNLSKCKLRGKLNEAAKTLVDFHLNEASKAWRNVPESRIPKEVKLMIEFNRMRAD